MQLYNIQTRFCRGGELIKLLKDMGTLTNSITLAILLQIDAFVCSPFAIHANFLSLSPYANHWVLLYYMLYKTWFSFQV